jgi:hypothetical protein
MLGFTAFEAFAPAGGAALTALFGSAVVAVSEHEAQARTINNDKTKIITFDCPVFIFLFP